MKKLFVVVTVVSLILAINSTAGAVNFAAGGDRLVDLQNADGGWDWPLDDGDPLAGSAPNTIGPIGMGLAQAYLQTGDPDYLSALKNVANLLQSKLYNFSPSDGYLAVILDDILGGTSNVDHVKTYFYDPLAFGTYDLNDAGILYTTEDYVNLIRTARKSQGIANLAAWDIGMGLVAAASVGADPTAWIAGTKAEIDELDGNEEYDVIGLAGSIYGLAYVGEDYDPTAGEHAGAGDLLDLADTLASYQIDGGGFTWNSKYLNPDESNETVQETAYAILALLEVDSTRYFNEILGAADYLGSVQLATGGWENYVGDGENNEVTAEALWAASAASAIPEPSTMLLLGFGLIGIVGLRKKLHKK